MGARIRAITNYQNHEPERSPGPALTFCKFLSHNHLQLADWRTPICNVLPGNHLQLVCASPGEPPLFALRKESGFSEQSVDQPAAADVFARLSAVVKDVGVGAAGLFEGVGED